LSATDNTSPTNALAIDFGLRRIGIATASRVADTASPLTTVQATDGEPRWDEFDALVAEWTPDIFVVGLPYNSDRSESEMAQRARNFGAALTGRYNLPVSWVDERYTSAEAEAVLKQQRQQGIRPRKLKKEDIDSMAAAIIADSWLRESRQNP